MLLKLGVKADGNTHQYPLTALCIAVGNRNYEMAELLLQHGASPNVYQDVCHTPLRLSINFTILLETWPSSFHCH